MIYPVEVKPAAVGVGKWKSCVLCGIPKLDEKIGLGFFDFQRRLFDSLPAGHYLLQNTTFGVVMLRLRGAGNGERSVEVLVYHNGKASQGGSSVHWLDA
jgi:hypothetical protein